MQFMQCRPKTCLSIVMALVALTCVVYILSDFYLHSLHGDQSISSATTPMAKGNYKILDVQLRRENNERNRQNSNKLVKANMGKSEDDQFANLLAEMRGNKINKNNGRKGRDLLDCDKVLQGDQLYIGRHRARNPRLRYRDPVNRRLPMDCASIGRRNAFKIGDPTKDGNATFAVAFARNVFKDYRFLEMELLANYSAQNWYCYTIDTRAKPLFKLRLRALARCFPNVLVSAKHFPMDSAGHFTSDALMECARELANPSRSWHYLITLQNHDIQMKSNLEMADRLAMLDEANDIEFGENNKFTRQRLQFYLDHYKWSFDALKILRDGNGLRSKGRFGQPLRVNLAKGSMSASLSRTFVDYIVQKLDLRLMLRQLNGSNFGVDEHLFQSLVSTGALFPKDLEIQRVSDRYITRHVQWSWNEGRCRSGIWRHSVCVFGIADIGSQLVDNDFLFANKMMPEEDMEAIHCWHREMRLRNRN